MSDLDTATFAWFGDTLFNVVLLNLALVGPVHSRPDMRSRSPGAIGARWGLYRAFFGRSALLDYGASAGGELWSIGGFSLAGRYNSRSGRSPSD